MIDINKKYKTESGLEVVLYWVGNMVHGAIIFDHIIRRISLWNLEGIDIISQNEYNLVEVSPYDHLKIDDKVWAYNSDGQKHKIHFAGIDKDGKPLCFHEGKTSWSSDGGYKSSWPHVELYVEEGGE